jgi:hypothetical protein
VIGRAVSIRIIGLYRPPHPREKPLFVGMFRELSGT